MDNEYYKSCTKCGRPQTICKGECCGKPRKACIRQTTPSCCNDAVIPTVTVATVADMKGITNALVHVADNNTTYYIDDNGRLLTTWSGLASVPDYDFDANPLNLRNQVAYDASQNIGALYDKQGNCLKIQISPLPDDYDLLNNKPIINGVELRGNLSLDDLGLAPTSDEVKYYFPNRTKETTYYVLVKAYGKVILYDTGRGTKYGEPQYLEQNLDSLGISHIDYVAVSHYHYDHAGGLLDLLKDGYVDGDTILYLPSYDTSVWASDSSYPVYTELMAKLQELGYSYITPTEGMKVNLNDNFSLQFYNTDDTYYVDHGLSNYYNNASMNVIIRHFDFNSWFVGDSHKLVFRTLIDRGVIPQTIHLYTLGHHGIVDRGNSVYAILSNLTIKNGVQVVGIDDVADGKCSGGGEPTDDANMIDDIFVCAYNPKMIQFASNVDSMSLIYGYESGTDNLNNTQQHLYVDASATTTQDGTQAHPFKQLNQCLGFCQRNRGVDYTIHIANGIYKTSPGTDQSTARAKWKPAIMNTNNTIEIVGESKDGVVLYDGIIIRNAANVKIRNVTFTAMYALANLVDLTNSNVVIDNCVINGLWDYRGISSEGGRTIVSNSTFNTAANGIHEINSTIDCVDCTFTNMQYNAIYGVGGCFNRVTGVVITDASHLYNYTGTRPTFPNGLEIFNGSVTYNTNESHTFTTLAYGARFERIKVFYNLRGFSGCREALVDQSNSRADVGIGDDAISDTWNSASMYNVTIRFGWSDTASFRWSRKFDIMTDGTITLINDNDDLEVTKVIAY